MSKTARNGKVDLFKFIFSIVVIIYHFGNAVKFDNELFNKGYIGVEFFFIVSGFLFAKSLAKIPYHKETLPADSVHFMWRKYKSFLPYHFFTFVCTFITASIISQWNISNIAFELANSIPDFFMIQINGVSKMSLLGHEWYISAMLIAMFVLTPFVIKFRDIFLKYIAPALAFFILALLFHSYGNLNAVGAWIGVFNSGFLRALAEISLGCVCFAVSEKGFIEKFPKPVLIITELTLYTLVILYANKSLGSVSELSIVIMLAFAVTISFSPKSSLAFLNNKFVLFLGKISFPIYLTQIFVRQALVKSNLGLDYFSYMGLYVFTVIAVSLLCILICDSIVNFIHKNINKPTAV